MTAPTPSPVTKWIPVWEKLPPVKEEVAVLVILSDGETKRDIGTYFGAAESEGWYCQFWNDRPRVAAWCELPAATPPAAQGE